MAGAGLLLQLTACSNPQCDVDPSIRLTRSPLRKFGAESWVTTRVVPSSMRSVTRYIAPADEPVAPAAPLLPIAAEPAPEVLGRGIASIDMTTAFGAPDIPAAPLGIPAAPPGIPAAPLGIPAAPCACDELPMLPAPPLVAALPPLCEPPLAPLPMLPLEPLEPLPMLSLELLEPLEPLPMLPLPIDPLEPLPMLPLPMLPLPMLPLEPPASLEPLEPPEPLEPLLPVPLPVAPPPDSSPPPRMELHPASVSASKPASTTLCCLRFMINSLSCLPCSGCA
jgi:hypothetical protein